MDVQTRTVYTVTWLDGTCKTFDNANTAADTARSALRSAAGDISAYTDAFGGSVTWDTDEVPATPFDVLLDTYIDELHAEGGADGVDRESPFLLVEENCRGGYWLSSGMSPEALYEYHSDQEYAEEWEVVGIFDTATGDRVHGTIEIAF